ncbi:hypothetical protein SAY86_013561 [Trapa natans]|uniref:Endopeptidase S2P n=1 Tax=Trapa natans TaxID=22666 RepID=A0AAN7KYU6_TRANT|nr:hypothetical protein SAY86_013561 [Trapa natans]
MEQGRRVRRFGIGRGRGLDRPRGILPLNNTSEFSDTKKPRLSYTLSCWYCDLQILAFSEPIFRFGRRNARYLQIWFSIGVGFGVTLMLVLAPFLLWELAGFLHFHESGMELSKLVFGFSPTVSGLTISLVDTGFILLSTLISVTIHEIGHIMAAASEGVQVEYLAIFIAILFPGALVAFNHESLQELQPVCALRIYCAGIWHNAMCCAICGLTLLLLPWILFPLYIYGQGCMVLEVPYSSPLHEYLSPADVLVALDGIPVSNLQEWAVATSALDVDSYQEPNYTRYSGKGSSMKGYCIPTVLLEENVMVRHVDGMSTCPNDLTAFTSMPCSHIDTMDYAITGDSNANTEEHTRCLNAKEVIKLKKCGDGWSHIVSNGSNCICLQDESCFAPISGRGSTWVEVTYTTPNYSPECSQIELAKLTKSWTSVITETNCGGSFVYVGDAFSFFNSIYLTSYRPRFWASGIGAYFPNVVEKILSLTYHVSVTLALLNALPVFFLDGESILEVMLSYCCRTVHWKKKLCRLILASGTLISGLSFVRMVARGY